MLGSCCCDMIRVEFHGNECDLRSDYLCIAVTVMIQQLVEWSCQTALTARAEAETRLLSRHRAHDVPEPHRPDQGLSSLADLHNTLQHVRPSTFLSWIDCCRSYGQRYESLLWPPLIAEKTASARYKAGVVFARIAQQDKDSWNHLSL